MVTFWLRRCATRIHVQIITEYPPPISSNPVLPIIPKFNPNTNYSFNPIPNLNRIAVGEI